MNTLRTIVAVARRELAKIAADRWTLIAVTIAPLVAGVVLALIYTNSVVLDIPTVVVDRDHTAASRAFARALDAHESLRVIRTVESEEEGEAAIRSGEASCVVVLPPDFERNVKRGDRSALLCFLNGSNMVLSNYALKAVSTTITTATAGIAIDKMEKTGTPASHALESYGPLAINPQYLFNPGQNYGNFFLPGILAALLQQVVAIGAALTWARESHSGGFPELLGITRNVWTIATGKLLVYVAIGLAWALFFFGGLFPLFGVPYTGSLLAGLITVVLMLTGMTLLAMMISSFLEHRETAMQVTFIVSSPAFLLSGYTFPQMAMTGVARWTGMLIPLTPFLTAWRRVVLYNGGVADILGEIAMLAASIILYGGIMVFVMRKRIVATFSVERKSQI